jgi:hypothetical protein
VTENAKTGVFIGAAALLAFVAWLAAPKQVSNRDQVDQVIGQPLFDRFSDPGDVASLKIVKYNEELGTMKKFDLARDSKSGAWIIPSHDSYPADASSQIGKVSNAFIDLKALLVASRSAADHKSFGVLEPDDGKTQAGESGVGTLVSMENQKGEVLVDLIIGKEVKDEPKQRYVRRVGSDPVFAAEIDPSILATDFDKWIEGDLLKLSSNDISNLTIRDYNVITTQDGRGLLKKNFNADIDYVIVDGKWKANSIEIFDKAKATPRVVADDEELNTTKLNEIKNTLDSLKIVDVARKPKGLAADLKADKELLDDRSAVESLTEKGFYPISGADGSAEIVSANGELVVKLKDGIEYLLRFGEAFGSLGGSEDGEKDKEKKSSSGSSGLYRTLFVTTKVNEAAFPMPELAKVPESVEEMKAMEAKAREQEEKDKAAEAAMGSENPLAPEPSAEVPPPANSPTAEAKESIPDPLRTKSENAIEKAAKEVADPKPEAGSPAAEVPKVPDEVKDAPASTESTPDVKDQSNRRSAVAGRFVSTQADGSSEEPTTEPAKEEPKAEAAKKEPETSSKPHSDEKKPEAKAGAVESDDKKPSPEEAKPVASGDDSKPDTSTPSVESKKAEAESEAELKERLEAMREKITKQNTRNIEDRNDQLEKAKKKSGELNARFADWYYEISDAEYKRLRVTLDDLIKKKTGSSGETK